MTFAEVVKKWSKKHKGALKDVLKHTSFADTQIIIPKEEVHNMVTDQILTDLGFIRVDITKDADKKILYVYAISED